MTKLASASLLFFVCFGFTSMAPPANDPDALVGKWLSPHKRNQVQIYRQGNKFYGKVVWMLEPNNSATGKSKLDAENPTESLRNRPIVGLVIMSGLEHKGKNVWGGGEIYNPDDGRTYGCEITMRGPNTLDMRGYLTAMPLIGRTKTWTRVN